MHQHKGYFIMWMLFLVGQILSVLMRADTFSSSKYTPWHNAWAYIEAHALSLIYTFFISSMLATRASPKMSDFSASSSWAMVRCQPCHFRG